MTDIPEQIANIEKEIRETPYHKATEHYIGKLRAKLAKLKEKEVEKQGKKGGGGGGYAVKKQGDATVVLVGPPSVGKSTLLNKLTNAKSKIAPYAFTTVSVIPGMMEYKDAHIQILDVPGLIKGAEEGKGRGREVLSVVRGADLLILVTDIEDIEAIERIRKTLENNGIRIDKTPPDVSIEKKISGGLTVRSNIKQDIDKETIQEVSKEFGIKNGEITIKEKLTMETLIDAFSKNRAYIPSIEVINKSDLAKGKKEGGYIYISAEEGENLDGLKEAMWEKLDLVRIYLVRPDEEPGEDNPLIVKAGDTLKEAARKVGEDFAQDKQSALIWGPGAKYGGQEVSLSTKVKIGMQVRFIS
jgi:hypothetical protein